MNNLRFKKCDENAVTPSRAHEDDAGYDLTVIGIYKTVSDSVTLYETGIAVQPPAGYHTEIVPRSSLSGTGHMLANSVGIIDAGYTGSLKIPVIKVDKSSKDLEIPFTKFQLIMRKTQKYELEEVDSFDETVRGDGGFGSTDK